MSDQPTAPPPLGPIDPPPSPAGIQEEPSALDQRINGAFCWALSHWLAITLTVLMVFVSLPFLAPVAMNAGWNRVGQAIHMAYIPFCHQLPQRSFFFFGPNVTYALDTIAPAAGTSDAIQLRFFHGSPELGWKMAWSDRMVWFYFMTPVFGIVYALMRATGREIRPISWKVFVLAMAPMFIDGITHILNDLFFGISSGGFRDTNAWLATLTGNAFPGFYAGDHFGTFNWWMRMLTGLLAAWGLAFFVFPQLDLWIAREREQTCGRAGQTQVAGR